MQQASSLALRKNGKSSIKTIFVMKGIMGMGTILVVCPHTVGHAIIFLDLVPSSVGTLREMCSVKKIALSHPHISTLTGIMGFEKTRQKKTSGATIQMVVVDRMIIWGVIPV